MEDGLVACNGEIDSTGSQKITLSRMVRLNIVLANQPLQSTSKRGARIMILIILLILLFGGGGFYGYRSGYYGRGGMSLLAIAVICFVFWLLVDGGVGHTM